MKLSLTQATHEAEDRRQWREYTRLSERAYLRRHDTGKEGGEGLGGKASIFASTKTRV